MAIRAKLTTMDSSEGAPASSPGGAKREFSEEDRAKRKERVQKAKDARLILQPRLVMLKQEGVNGVLHMQAGAVKTPLDGAAVARFQFQVGEPFQGSRRLRLFSAACWRA